MANNPPSSDEQQSLLGRQSENVEQESSDSENGDVTSSATAIENFQTAQEEVQLQSEQSQKHSSDETGSDTYASNEQLTSLNRDSEESSYYSPPELSEELRTQQEIDTPQIPIPSIPEHSPDEPENESPDSAEQEPQERIVTDPIEPVAGPSGTVRTSEELIIETELSASSTRPTSSTVEQAAHRTPFTPFTIDEGTSGDVGPDEDADRRPHPGWRRWIEVRLDMD